MAAHGSSHSATHDGGHDDHGGASQYWMVFGALCGLTTLSFFTYSSYWPFKDTPAVGWVFMMAVSSCKAMLVMLYFMHLKWEAAWKYVLTVPASIMSFFLVLSLIGDVGQRGRYYSEERYLNAAVPVVETADHDDAKHHDHDHGDHAHDHDKKPDAGPTK